ncbi:MAG: transglycosylase family protein [Candidatus Actinomarina sp.]|nr:transglycosylase family protein [Candidatus Actinomarina sp.]
MIKFLGFLAGGIAALLLAGFVLADPAWGNDSYNYKNPWKPTKNVDQIPDSLYRGWHYSPKHEDFRKCILRRESGANFKADSSGGSGGYQFIQSTWDAYVVKVDAGYVGVRPNKAPPYLQEEVFWMVVNPLAKKPGLEGRHHWSASHAHDAGYTGVKDC